MKLWRRNKHNGSALLTALFIMTLVAIAVTAMTLRLKVDITKMQIAINTSILKHKIQLPTFLGLQWLKQPNLPFSQQKPDQAVIKRFENLSNESNWDISGQIIDLQSRFNINNVENIKYTKTLQKLLINMGVELEKAKNISNLCRYWIRPHRLGRGKDPLLSQFIKQKPPYYPAFQPFISPSEIRLIPGINSHIAQKIIPHITALPGQTPINITTASPEVIKILGDGLRDSQVSRILELRNNDQINNKSKLDSLLKEFNIPPNQVTLESDYYLIVSKAKHDDNDLQQFTIVERKHSKHKKKVKLNIIFVSYYTL